MKIALAIENFSRHGGGAESYAVELARTLIKEGWEVHLYGYSWAGDPAEAIFHEIPKLSKLFPPSVRLIHFASCHKKMVAAEKFDVILGFGNTVVMNVYQSHGGVHHLSNIRKLKAVGNPVIRFLKLAAMLMTPKYHARSWIEGSPFRMNDLPEIVAISDMVRNDMASYFHVDKEQIKLVYNGIDQSRFSSRNERVRMETRRKFGFTEETLFLFMAYDFRKKGVNQLVEAAGRLKRIHGDGKFGIIVVGGPPTPNMSKRIGDLGISNLMIFPGSTKEPETYYNACDVFVLPTFYDACSLVVFEAMAAGLPVITSRFNGAAGIITPGEEGMILDDPGNIPEMARAMSLYFDRQRLTLASDAARIKAADYTLQENHRRMLEIFGKKAVSGS